MDGEMFINMSYDKEHEESISDLVMQDEEKVHYALLVPLGIMCTLAIIFSIILVLLLLLIKQKPAVIVIFINWCVANIIHTSVYLSIYMANMKTWVFGEFWCQALFYLLKSLSYTMPYQLLLVPFLLFVGRKRLRDCSGQTKWLFFLIPWLLSMGVGVVCFLLCIMYWSITSFQTVSMPQGDLSVCFFDIFEALPIVELILMFVLPTVALIALLTAWVCLKKDKPLSDRKDKVWLIILTTFVVLYFLAKIDKIGIFALQTPDGNAQVTNLYLIHYKVATSLSQSYHALAPIGAIVIMIIFRQTLFSTSHVNPPQTVNA